MNETSLKKPTITLPYPIRKCDGKPTPAYCHYLDDICKENALSFTEISDFGYIRLLVDGPEYRRITGEANDFTVPTKPAEPNYDNDSSQVAVARSTAKYDKELFYYHLFVEFDKALRTAILANVDHAYLLTLKHATLGWHKVTSKQLLEHLMKTYGKITSVEITEIEDKMKQPYHPSNGPLEPYWQQLSDGVTATKHCTRGKITEDQALTYAIANFAQSEVPAFKEALRKFDAKSTADQTLKNLKELITDAYNDLPAKDKAPVTAATAGYNSANNMEEKENQQPYPHYCWSHGVTWIPHHTSKNCNRPFPEHNEEATFYNLCGGCTRINRRGKDKAIWKPRYRNNNNGNNNGE